MSDRTNRTYKTLGESMDHDHEEAWILYMTAGLPERYRTSGKHKEHLKSTYASKLTGTSLDVFRVLIGDLELGRADPLVRRRFEELIRSAKIDQGRNLASRRKRRARLAGQSVPIRPQPGTATSGGGMTELTPEDKTEISAALETKANLLVRHEYGSEDHAGQDVAWAEHLREIMEKIGPEGCNLYHIATVPSMWLIDGYFCVFVGDPSICTPYAMFATYGQAEIFAQSLDPRLLSVARDIMTLTQWKGQYIPPEGSAASITSAEPSSPEPDPSPAEQTKPASH